MSKRDIKTLLTKLKRDYTEFQFIPSDTFKWSSKQNAIYYDLENHEGHALLLHELGHAILQHQDYTADVGLLQMEIEAWEKAKRLGAKYQVKITQGLINRCLDTYRDWLYTRSLCPKCEQAVMQDEDFTLTCHNCLYSWKLESEIH